MSHIAERSNIVDQVYIPNGEVAANIPEHFAETARHIRCELNNLQTELFIQFREVEKCILVKSIEL